MPISIRPTCLGFKAWPGRIDERISNQTKRGRAHGSKNPRERSVIH